MEVHREVCNVPSQVTRPGRRGTYKNRRALPIGSINRLLGSYTSCWDPCFGEVPPQPVAVAAQCTHTHTYEGYFSTAYLRC